VAPATFFFVRHGESEANAARRFSGHGDSPLTGRGRRQAEAVAEALRDVPFDRIVATPLSRSLDTALAVARRRRMPVDIERDLVEIDVGERTGATFDELMGLPSWRDDGFVAWPGGETLEQVLERALRAVRRLARDTPGGTLLVVGHGGVTRILVSHFLGVLPKLDRSPATNTSVTVVVTDGETGRVERLFESAHVEPLHYPSAVATTVKDLAGRIRDVPDFPKPGILFKDITTLLKDGDAFRAAVDGLLEKIGKRDVDAVVGMESRGFIFGAPIAYKLGVGFVPVRKLGKLPADVVSVEYDLEYGSATLEMHKDALAHGAKVLIVDDLLATGGTVAGTIELVKQLEGEIVACAFLIELAALHGRDKLRGYDVVTLISY